MKFVLDIVVEETSIQLLSRGISFKFNIPAVIHHIVCFMKRANLWWYGTSVDST